MDALRVTRAAAAARIAIGVGLACATRPLLALVLGEDDPTPQFVLFARTVGIRDALFGLGCLQAAVNDGRLVPAEGARRDETRRWVRLWLANEAADVAVAILSARRLGIAGATIAAASPMPFIAVDAWVLRQLAPGRG